MKPSRGAEWRTLNANMQTIEDGAIIVNFTPTAGDVHVKARQWFQDMDVCHFIEEHLQYLTRPSMRHYGPSITRRISSSDQALQQALQQS